jgi:hypothetical protein
MSVHIWLNYGTWDSLVVAQDTNIAKWLEIYILYNSVCCIHFRPLKIQLHYRNYLNFNFNVHRPPSALKPEEFSFQLTHQRNKLLAKGRIAYKVLLSNIVVFIHYNCCLSFFWSRYGCQKDGSTIQSPSSLSGTILIHSAD